MSQVSSLRSQVRWQLKISSEMEVATLCHLMYVCTMEDDKYLRANQYHSNWTQLLDINWSWDRYQQSYFLSQCLVEVCHLLFVWTMEDDKCMRANKIHSKQLNSMLGSKGRSISKINLLFCLNVFAIPLLQQHCYLSLLFHSFYLISVTTRWFFLYAFLLHLKTLFLQTFWHSNSVGMCFLVPIL